MRSPSPYLLLVLTTLFWSGNFVLGRAVRLAVPPLGLSFWRWAMALLMLLPFAWPHLRRQWPVLRRAWAILVLLGVVGVANFNTFVYLGVQTTTATNAVLIVSTTPVIIVALSRLILGEAVGVHQALGIVISLSGVLTIITRGQPAALFALDLSVGDLWILAAVVSWALYSVLLKWRPADLHPLGFLGATVVVGVLALTPLYAWEALHGPPVRFDAVTVGSVLYVALFASVLAYIFWNRAVGEIGANRAGQFIHLMPAFGTLLSMVFLGEKLRSFHLLGIVLIFSGIYLTTVWKPSPR